MAKAKKQKPKPKSLKSQKKTLNRINENNKVIDNLKNKKGA